MEVGEEEMNRQGWRRSEKRQGEEEEWVGMEDEEETEMEEMEEEEEEEIDGKRWKKGGGDEE